MTAIPDAELAALLGDLESDRAERKASMADRDDVRKAICAFANDLAGHGLPGVVFIGVHDDGRCAQLDVTDELLRKVSDLRGEGLIQPLPSMTVRQAVVSGCQVIVIQVEPAVAPPVRFRGRVYVRVGPTTHVASREDEARLAERRRGSDLPFDLHPVGTATTDDLDLELFKDEYLPHAVDPEILRENARSVDEQLRALRFVSVDGVPTVVGVLVLAFDVRQVLPGAYVQFVSYDGIDLASPIRDQKQVSGPLSQLLRRLDELIDAHNSVAMNLTERSVETLRPAYPVVALQQIIRNAVLHRSYDATNAPVRLYWFEDRVEVHSPGGPFGQVSRSNFGTPGLTDYRNPHLAEAMRTLGYVQRFGVGIPVARRELERNGNPPLEFDAQPTFVLATVRRA